MKTARQTALVHSDGKLLVLSYFVWTKGRFLPGIVALVWRVDN